MSGGTRDPFQEIFREFFANDPFFREVPRFFRDDRLSEDDRFFEPTQPRAYSTYQQPEPEATNVFQRMAHKGRNFLNKMFSRFDSEPVQENQNLSGNPGWPYPERPVRRAPDIFDIWNQRSDEFFGDDRDRNLSFPGRRGFFEDGPTFIEHPEGEANQLPRTMFRSYSMSTSRGEDGEMITTTTIRDASGTRTTVTKQDGTVIEGNPEDVPNFPRIMDPSDFGGLLGSMFGNMFGQGFPHSSIRPAPGSGEPADYGQHAPVHDFRESILSDEFLRKERRDDL